MRRDIGEQRVPGEFAGCFRVQLQLEFDFGTRHSIPRDGRTGGAIEAEFGQGGEFCGGLNAFGNDCQTDVVGDAAQAFEECLVAALAVDGANETAVDLEVIEAHAVQAADFTELAAEMLDAEAAAQRAQCVAEGLEGSEVLEGADFGDFQPQAGRQVLAATDQGQQAGAECGVDDRFPGEIDGYGRRAGGNTFEGEAGGGEVELGGHRQTRGHGHETAGGQPFAIVAGLQAQRAFEMQQMAAAAGDREFDQAQALGLDGAIEQLLPVGIRGGLLVALAVCLLPGEPALAFGSGEGGIDAG